MTMNKTSVVVVVYLLAAAGAIITARCSAEEIAPAPFLDQQEEYFDACLKRLTEKCVGEVMSAIFKGTTTPVGCCDQLFKMGKECLERVINALLELPNVKAKLNVPHIWDKSELVWKQCVPFGLVKQQSA